MSYTSWDLKAAKACSVVLNLCGCCMVLIVFQVVYTILNPANPVDSTLPTKYQGVEAFRDCVEKNASTPTDQWYEAMKVCQKRKEFFSHKTLDLPY